MSISLRYNVGQLSVVEGARYPDTQNILAIQPDSFPESTRSDFGLFALIELSGLVPPPADLQEHLLSVLADEFYQSSGSVSLGLQQAILRANEELYEFNVNSVRDDRQGGGVTCIALRDAEFYIAQGGPALAYLVETDHAVRFPKESPWFDDDVPEDLDDRPLGASRNIKPVLSHRQFRAGDVIILSESILGQSVPVSQIEEAVSPGDIALTGQRIADLIGEDDISLAVIEIQPDRAYPEAVAWQGEPIDESEVAIVPPVISRSHPKPKGKVGHRVAKGKHTAGAGFPQNLWSRIDWGDISSGVKKAIAAVGAAIVVALGVIWSNVTVLAIRILPGSREIERIPKREVKKPAQPKPTPKVRQKSFWNPPKSVRFLKYVALAIPIVVLVIVGLVYLERERAAYSAHDQLIQSAKAKYDQALSEMANVDLTRSLLVEALAMLDDAKVILPVATEPPSLRTDILKNMDQLNQVKRVYWIPRLHEYADPRTDLSRIIVDGINIYVLDRGTNQVFKHVLNETEDGLQDSAGDPVLIGQGEQVEDVVVSELLDMNWMPAGGGRQTSNLVIIDKSGSLFDYSPTWNVKHRPLGDTDTWLYPQLIGGFYGNLYVLDAQLNQILKYLPTTADEGYSNSPVNYISEGVEVDLSGVVDMAIDGLYLFVVCQWQSDQIDERRADIF